VASVGVLFLVADLIQRTLVAGFARAMPSRRGKLLAKWQRALARAVLRIVGSVGGAHIDPLPSIPGQQGVLIFMNHQSLLDIPLVVAAMKGEFPLIVTRQLYSRKIPLISHMVRLYRYPLVNPGATTRASIAGLRDQASSTRQPLVIFPEGHRTRDGKIRPFRTLGLKTVLAARPWTVYVVVADGFWRCARLPDFIRNVSSVRGRVEVRGPFQAPPPGSELGPFAREVREHMCEMLDQMRESATS
jgi:1-acyl-sn-glycerol-3-phosphate acyltransferase